MKKAFSLLELVLSLIILGVLIVVLARPGVVLYEYAFKVKKTNEIFSDINQALLSIEKIYQTCIDVKHTKHSLECYMGANDDIFYDLSLKKFNFSGVILDDNQSFISPKSHFHFIENGISKGVLSHYKDIVANKKLKIYPDDYIYLYDLQHQKLRMILADDKEKIHFIGEKWSGFYSVVYAYVKVYFEDEKIYIQVGDLNHKQKRFLLMQDVFQLEFTQESKALKATICSKKQNECLSKWMFL
ncbi:MULTISPECIES: type II secretion system protein [unclassified Campylobacter]|uniref:type II secretion system protein n=1 Tax=unclassified Campylobacter TaxID=2593542 RepID=UPI000EA8EA3A|nr:MULTISPECIES: type II secretion system protein [unclassified Campylobacter]QOR00619.1 type II secretion system protein [Campylobacter sp. 2014D-0216]RKO65445.1 hypothetical protein CKA54_01105 [Campylobacter sp. P255]